MILQINPTVAEMYPFAPIRGYRITRLEEAPLGPFRLDATTAASLGREQLGVFVGNCGDLQRIIDKVQILADTDFPGRWVTVLSSKDMADIVYNRAWEYDHPRFRRHAPRYWDRGNVIFTTPEGLGDLSRDGIDGGSVAGILLVDTLCHVHKARNRVFRGYGVNDRPQRIANFRADLACGDWQPPFLFFTSRPAKSVNTHPMLSPYCLNAWWFVDGARLRVGKPPMAASSSILRSEFCEVSR